MYYRRGRSADDGLRVRNRVRQRAKASNSASTCCPHRIVGEDGRITGARTRFAPIRRAARAQPLPGTEFIEPVDTVIRAIGQSRSSRRCSKPSASRTNAASRRRRPHADNAAGHLCRRRLHLPKPGRAKRWWSKRREQRQDRRAQHRCVSARRSRADGRSHAAISRASRARIRFGSRRRRRRISGYQVMRAFAAGWGGAVWKTLGDPIVNVTSRFAGAQLSGANKMIGMNNIELITDRPLEENLREIAECKAAYPDRAIVASLMTDCSAERVARTRRTPCKTRADRRLRAELRLSARHVGTRHGLGRRPASRSRRADHALGQRSRATFPSSSSSRRTSPTSATRRARRARGGADAISLINTINSLMGVDLDTWNPIPHVDGK